MRTKSFIGAQSCWLLGVAYVKSTLPPGHSQVRYESEIRYLFGSKFG